MRNLKGIQHHIIVETLYVRINNYIEISIVD